MSMHEIESLVECSVLTLDAARPVPADARDLCYSLYELQAQFDCGYTILRVPEALERLGYLRRLPVEQLPEHARTQAQALQGNGGFIGASSEAYFDAQSGLCCVTAGTALWDELCRMGVLPKSEGTPVRRLPVLELAERIAALASAQGGENAAETMGLWYAILPAFLLTEGEIDEKQELSPRLLALRDRLAVPEALAAAAVWKLLPKPDELDPCDAFEAQWLWPYAAQHRAEQKQEAQKQLILEVLQQDDYTAACRLAEALPEEADRVYYRAAASLCFYRRRADGKELPPFDGLMTLEEARAAFVSLLSDTEHDSLCYMSMAACDTLMGEYERAFGALRDGFQPALDQVRETCGEPWMQRFTEAALAVTFYRIVWGNIPDSAPGKARMMTERTDGLLTLAEAQEAFLDLMRERSEEAWSCHFHLGVCLLLEGDRCGALRELREADRLHPGDPEVAAALKLAAGIQE